MNTKDYKGCGRQYAQGSVEVVEVLNYDDESHKVDNDIDVLKDLECCDATSLSNGMHLLIVAVTMEDKSEDR